jgi:hypothetical protein
MKKQYATVLLALICLLGLSVGAQAEDEGKIVVNVPYAFVAAGKTLPAGTYSVSRISPETHRGLIIRSGEQTAFVLPVTSDDIPAEHARLSFEHVGDKYFLSSVETPLGTYTIATPRPETKVAKVREQEAGSSSGTN